MPVLIPAPFDILSALAAPTRLPPSERLSLPWTELNRQEQAMSCICVPVCRSHLGLGKL